MLTSNAPSISTPPAEACKPIAFATASPDEIGTLPEALDRVKSTPAPVVPTLEAVAEVIVNAPVAPVKETVPVAVKSVNDPGRDPAARTGAKLEGVTNRAKAPVEAVPAIASASVASCPIPATVVVDTGLPAIAKASA